MIDWATGVRDDMESLTVCVPTYNGEKHIRPCIRSILDQTHRELEILIVDDCSQDRTVEIVKEMTSGDRRVRLFQNSRNLGLVGNWNRCVELVQTSWVKFVFQDDTIRTSCVEKMLDAACDHAEMVVCSREFTFEEGVTDKIRNWYLANQALVETKWGDTRVVRASEFQDASLDRLLGNLIGEPTSVMLRRSVFEKYGVFNSMLIMSCDLEYWSRIGVNQGFVWLNERLANFRVHQGATSANNREARSYRMDILDDLVVLHEFAFNPVYAPLRRAARQRSIDLVEIFSTRAVWARNVARVRSKQPTEGLESCIKEWEAVAARYFRIRRPPGSLRRRLLRVLNQVRDRRQAFHVDY